MEEAESSGRRVMGCGVQGGLREDPIVSDYGKNYELLIDFLAFEKYGASAHLKKREVTRITPVSTLLE